MNAPIKKGDRIIVNGAVRTRDRPKRTWVEAIKKDLKILNSVEEMALNRTEWKKKIHVAYAKILG